METILKCQDKVLKFQNQVFPCIVFNICFYTEENYVVRSTNLKRKFQIGFSQYLQFNFILSLNPSNFLNISSNNFRKFYTMIDQ